MGKTLLDNLDWPPFAIRMSPDGTQIAFAEFHQGESITLNVVDVSGKQRLLGVVSDQTPNRVDPILNWTPDGKEIWYRSFNPSEWGNSLRDGHARATPAGDPHPRAPDHL